MDNYWFIVVFPKLRALLEYISVFGFIVLAAGIIIFGIMALRENDDIKTDITLSFGKDLLKFGFVILVSCFILCFIPTEEDTNKLKAVTCEAKEPSHE